MSYIIGIDSGGTKTHGVLVDNSQNIVSEVFNGPGNINNDFEAAFISITQSIDQLVSTKKVDNSKLTVGIGVAGYSVSEKRIKLENMLNQRYPLFDFRINSDCYMAHKSAHRNADGAILICGTGVVGYAVQKGMEYRIGGWGFPQGDIGGGAWIGLEICKLICKAIDGVIPWGTMLESIYVNTFDSSREKFFNWLIKAGPKDFGKLVDVFVKYTESDVYASGILMNGVTELKNILRIIKGNTLSIKMFGGLSSLYLPYLQRDFNLSLAEQPAVFGASYM